ncbi:hypothetical protein [Dyadobacter luticola]|uniref:DUF642 domain-containing protein n=1 Tax=Dyadobacter luticola TaxID=1979387 RepID=A0A5R9KRK8_9BACT|nr:hypothetical protein [Dyadobacter luticola]TLU98921.1 hypothetical protein FEN17_20230 [Dyadobacter luticola]
MIILKRIYALYPIALFLFGLLSTISCSKDYTSNLPTDMLLANSDSNMEPEMANINGTDTLMIPWMPSTDGTPGKDSFPAGWGRHDRWELEPDYAPIGTSNLNALCGGLQWTVPLPAPNGPGSIITTSSTFGAGKQAGRTWPVEAEIANLETGKKYSITVQVSTSKTAHSQYSNKARFEIFQSGNEHALVTEFVDLKDNFNRWITKVITFVSTGQKAGFCFSVETEKGLNVNHGNIYVGPDAIKMLN